MTKMRIAVITAVCVLLAVFILWFKAPSAPKPAAPAEQKAEEPQVGKYELPAAQERPEYPAAQARTPETAPPTGELAEQKTKKTLTAGPESPQIYEPDPSLPEKPPKLPPPEVLKDMRQRGIVAY